MRKAEAGEVYSISAGLDYPSVGPEHAQLKDMGRAEYVSVTDREALDAFFALSRHEGVIPALESSHALAQAIKMARPCPRTRCCWSAFRAAGTKTWPRWPS